MNPDQPNGVTGLMMEAGAEAFMRSPYIGVAINVGSATPKVLESASAIGCALARAFPAMLDKAEGGVRDTLLHPGQIGGSDLLAWQAMSATARAEFVLHQAPAHVLGMAAVLARQRSGNPGMDAGLAFLTDALTALARQMERAVAVQRREQQRRMEAAIAAEEQARANVARVRAARPKRKRAKRRKAVAA